MTLAVDKVTARKWHKACEDWDNGKITTVELITLARSLFRPALCGLVLETITMAEHDLGHPFMIAA